MQWLYSHVVLLITAFIKHTNGNGLKYETSVTTLTVMMLYHGKNMTAEMNHSITL